MLSVSERLSKFKNWNGLFLSTQEHLCSRFLYYFCLCKSFKELFLYQCLRGCSLKADAKVRLFSELPKLFQEKFQKYMHFLFGLDLNQNYFLHTPLYIIYKGRKCAIPGFFWSAPFFIREHRFWNKISITGYKKGWIFPNVQEYISFWHKF